MAEHFYLPYRFILPGLLVLFLSWSPNLIGQSDSLMILSDTSYFRDGEDDWNLLESILKEEPASVLFLLKRGANPDATETGGKTALMFAAEFGDTLILKILTLNGADIELTDRKETTALIVASLNQQFSAVHFLLEKGAKPNPKDDYGGSALLYAAALNDYAIADLLLFYGASPTQSDSKGNDALMTAVCLGNMECVDVLLQNGILPDSRDKKQNTPLMIAAQNGDNDLINLLLEYDAEIDLVNSNNYTALAHAIRTGENGTVRVLVDSGANVNHLIKQNQNLYDLANQLGDNEIRKFIKSKGASPIKRPEFSEIGLALGNSFRSNEYFLQGRISLNDKKFGFFAETGFDARVVMQIVQVQINDTLIHQYRETRSSWTLGAGKYFKLATDQSGIKYGAYGALYGLLSFPKYRGISDRPPPDYDLMLSFGLYMKGHIAGLKIGAERYTFGTLLENPWKTNITLFVTFGRKTNTYHYKEISYD